MVRSLSFTVANFKAFADPVTIELAPVTLLYGNNNAGKSALLRLLPFLSESLDPRLRSALNGDSEAVRGARFSDLLCRASESQALETGFAWPGAELTVQFRELGNEIRASQFTTRHGDESLRATWAGPDDEYRFSNGTVSTLRFRGPVFEGPQVPPPASDLSRRVQALLTDVLWLEAQRDPTSRYEPIGAPPVNLGSRGQNAVRTLAADDDVRARVSAWYEQHFGQALTLVSTATHVRADLQRPSVPFSVPIVDCGEGFSQVLPVITACAQAALGRGPRTLCLEHPEMHLHPDAHPTLASLFCDLVRSSPGVTVFLETHSENLLLALLLAIASGELSPDAVAVYWVRQFGDGTSTADRVTVDALGRPGPELPPTVFRRTTDLGRRLLEQRRAHR